MGMSHGARLGLPGNWVKPNPTGFGTRLAKDKSMCRSNLEAAECMANARLTICVWLLGAERGPWPRRQ